MTTDPLRRDTLQPGWLMFLACEPAVRLWSGAANFKLGPCGPDTAGGVYFGMGIIVGVPQLKLPQNGSYSQHVFSLAGVSAESMRLVDGDREIVRGSALSWARVELDAAGQPMAEPVWLWKGWVDSVRLSREGSTKPPTRTVSLVCSTGSVTRKRRQASYYTAPQQRAIDPNDASCDQVALYAAGTSPIWPN